jgi:hypothetical protein
MEMHEAQRIGEYGLSGTRARVKQALPLTVTTTAANGLNAAIALSVSGSPKAVTAELDPSQHCGARAAP